MHFEAQEIRALLGISAIFALRMVGLFLILPIFRDYAQVLFGNTPQLMGITVGIYGLTQAMFQIPFGMLSDRCGRKPIIAMGLLLFCLGSVVAALSGHIYGVLIGRALQGMGAIGAILTVSLNEMMRPALRTRAMAYLGMVIGLSFVLSMLMGPVLNLYWTVPQLFWGMALASLGALFVLQSLPEPHAPTPLMAGDLLKQAVQLLRKQSFIAVISGVLMSHACLTAIFLLFPHWLKALGLLQPEWWKFYLPVFTLGFTATLKMVHFAEKKDCLTQALIASALTLLGSFCTMILWHGHLGWLFVWAVMFFMSFSFLEAGLPAWNSQRVNPNIKGMAMGIYSSCMFLGTFLGGVVMGALL